MKAPLLKIQNLSKYFPVKKGLFLKTSHYLKAVDQVSIEIFKGEVFGLVGESGCGKTTLGRTIIRLYEPTSGQVEFDGMPFSDLTSAELKNKRKDIQMIFQDPYASLDPRRTISHILEQPLKLHFSGSTTKRQQKLLDLISKVGLNPDFLERYPHEFSGGQRQRIAIARALATGPKMIVADEPVSALDVSIQAQILNLMKDLGEEMGLTYLFISHDLSVMDFICDRIGVMYLGKIVEIASKEELFNSPHHPYTKALLASMPRVGAQKRTKRFTLTGEVPNLFNPPKGCPFHPRCTERLEICSKQVPPLLEIVPGAEKHFSACHLVIKSQMRS